MHQEHRRRFKARLIKSGFDSFADHELMEAVLLYSIPRKNTNETAHDILEHFGSLEEVIFADTDELSKVKGVGENTLALIKLISNITRKIAFNRKELDLSLNSKEKILRFSKNLFVGAICETVYAVYLDNAFTLVDYNCISTGCINEVKPMIRTIAESALRKNAASVLLLHNHPNGASSPSKFDEDITLLAKESLSLFNINLIDHLVFGFDGCSSITNEIVLK